MGVALATIVSREVRAGGKQVWVGGMQRGKCVCVWRDRQVWVEGGGGGEWMCVEGQVGVGGGADMCGWRGR